LNGKFIAETSSNNDRNSDAFDIRTYQGCINSQITKWLKIKIDAADVSNYHTMDSSKYGIFCLGFGEKANQKMAKPGHRKPRTGTEAQLVDVFVLRFLEQPASLYLQNRLLVFV